MIQLHSASLSIKIILLFLPQTIQMLSLITLKDCFYLIQIPGYMSVSGHIIVLLLRAQQRFSCHCMAVSYIKAGPVRPNIHLHLNQAVSKDSFVPLNRHLYIVCPPGRQKRPRLIRQHPVPARPETDTIRTIGLYPDYLIPALKANRILFHLQLSHTTTS